MVPGGRVKISTRLKGATEADPLATSESSRTTSSKGAPGAQPNRRPTSSRASSAAQAARWAMWSEPAE